MASTGYIQVRAYASYAQLPLQDVAVIITDPDGTAIAFQLTDRSGLTEPIAISVPDISAGLSPNTGIVPFKNINIYARLDHFEQIEAENVQVFPNVVTIQNFEMVPLAELPENWAESELFNTPPQNL